MEIKIPYYEDNTRISNSAIGWFLKKGPAYLHSMLEGKEEGLTGSFLSKGTMIHMYILQPEEFWKNYEILDFETPSSKQQIEFAKQYVNSTEIDEDRRLLSAYQASYSTTNQSQDKQLEKAKELSSKLPEYIKYLDKSNTKEVITWADFNMLKSIEDNLRNHVKADNLLYSYDKDTFEVHNEFHINWELKNVQCKSLLDRCMIDHKNKKVILIDLKTTSDVYNFKHSVEEYDYYRQITFYLLAIYWYFTNELKLDCSDYDVEAYIIAIQTNGNFEVKVFNMFKEDIITDKSATIISALKDIKYHQDNNLWEHTREYYEGDGTEELRDRAA